jgi:hypothetical protein
MDECEGYSLGRRTDPPTSPSLAKKEATRDRRITDFRPGEARLRDFRDYFTQLGLRFSLKAAIPSRASSDSRACM